MKTLNIIQYIIGIAIFVIFFISLFPGNLINYYQLLILLILLQMIISISDKKIVNFIFEIGLLILALIISIPLLFGSIKAIAFLLSILVFVFKIAALPLAWLDFSTFKGYNYYQNFKFINKFESIGEPKKSTKKEKKVKDFKDAEFEEK